ncbi:hypothetical protein [Streptomyces sp. G44]|uniref:hypothetical protein n=1 Tax=Streptomyces sp. G44 TaxID=2807632 RepID=UPI001EF7C35A|nr:hypothetical protein [Streptomyces sp. G44]
MRVQLKLRMVRPDGDLARRSGGVSLPAGAPWAGRALRDRINALTKEGARPANPEASARLPC